MKEEDADKEPFWWDLGGWEMAFVDNMKTIRERRGLSQTEFAKRMSERGHRFHQPTVQRVERGERPLKFGEAISVADVLGIPFATMMEDISPALSHQILVSEVDPEKFNGIADELDRSVHRLQVRKGHLIEAMRDYVQATKRFEVPYNKELLAYAEKFQRTYEYLLPDVRRLHEDAQTYAKMLRQLERHFPEEFTPGVEGESGDMDPASLEAADRFNEFIEGVKKENPQGPSAEVAGLDVADQDLGRKTKASKRSAISGRFTSGSDRVAGEARG